MHNDDGYGIDVHGNYFWVDDNNKYHRLDGPAVIVHMNPLDWAYSMYVFDGIYFGNNWVIHGVRYTNFKDFQQAGGLSDEEMMVLRLKYGEIII
jgi:hypothetical protein